MCAQLFDMSSKSESNTEAAAAPTEPVAPVISCGACTLPRCEVDVHSDGVHATYTGDTPKQMKAPGPGGCYAKDPQGKPFVQMPGSTVTLCQRAVTEITEWKTGKYPKKVRDDLVRVHFRYRKTPPADGSECRCGVCGTYEWLDPLPCDCEKKEPFCHNNECSVM